MLQEFTCHYRRKVRCPGMPDAISGRVRPNASLVVSLVPSFGLASSAVTSTYSKSVGEGAGGQSRCRWTRSISTGGAISSAPAATPTGCAMPARQAEIVLVRAMRRRRYAVRELPPGLRPPLLKAYLDRYASEVQRFFPIPKGSSVEAFADLAPRYPVFELTPSPIS